VGGSGYARNPLPLLLFKESQKLKLQMLIRHASHRGIEAVSTKNHRCCGFGLGRRL
jgi:hypothetical protein